MNESTTLSIRQPWAWLIVNGFKDVENRTWMTKFRGPVLIHAAKGMTGDEYDSCQSFCHAINTELDLPIFDDLQRGGIVGTATITDCVRLSGSKWFTGPWGFVIYNSKPVPFVPCRGALGFFVPKL